jgi:hypothetical protein
LNDSDGVVKKENVEDNDDSVLEGDLPNLDDIINGRS